MDGPAIIPGRTLEQTCNLAEKISTVSGNDTFAFCWKKCITHFGEDAIPFHLGEKGCFDRCMSKVKYGFEMASVLKKEFNEGIKNDTLQFNWLTELKNGGNKSA
eukprot:Tbor_TRINITY_DN5773_c3_g3::TRINITY_DN5773_c3_g3_i1::g.20525::m.20525